MVFYSYHKLALIFIYFLFFSFYFSLTVNDFAVAAFKMFHKNKCDISCCCWSSCSAGPLYICVFALETLTYSFVLFFVLQIFLPLNFQLKYFNIL